MTDSTTAMPTPQCAYCGGVPHQHLGQCPSIKAIEYYQNGTIKRVEKISPAPWPYGDSWKIPEVTTVTGDRLYPLSGGKPFELP